MGTAAPDHYLVELRQRIAYYFEAPGVESQTRSGGLRLALTATGHKQAAAEEYSYGLMTSYLLPALRGAVPEVLEVEQQGQISLQRLHRYLRTSDAERATTQFVWGFCRPILYSGKLS